MRSASKLFSVQKTVFTAQKVVFGIRRSQFSVQKTVLDAQTVDAVLRSEHCLNAPGEHAVADSEAGCGAKHAALRVTAIANNSTGPCKGEARIKAPPDTGTGQKGA